MYISKSKLNLHIVLAKQNHYLHEDSIWLLWFDIKGQRSCVNNLHIVYIMLLLSNKFLYWPEWSMEINGTERLEATLLQGGKID